MTKEPNRRVGRLRKLQLTELSLVDRPANQHALVAMHKQQDEPVPPNSLPELIDRISKAENVSRLEAQRRFAQRQPEAVANASDRYVSSTRPQPVAKSEGAQRFETMVAKIAREQGVSRLAAMQIVREEHADVFAGLDA